MSKVWFTVQWGRPHTQKRWPYSQTVWVYLCPHPQKDMLMSSSHYLEMWLFAFRTEVPTRKWQKAGGCLSLTAHQPKPSWRWSQLLLSLWETRSLALYPVLNRHVLWATEVITWPRFPTYTNHCINPFFHFVDKCCFQKWVLSSEHCSTLGDSRTPVSLIDTWCKEQRNLLRSDQPVSLLCAQLFPRALFS